MCDRLIASKAKDHAIHLIEQQFKEGWIECGMFAPDDVDRKRDTLIGGPGNERAIQHFFEAPALRGEVGLDRALIVTLHCDIDILMRSGHSIKKEIDRPATAHPPGTIKRGQEIGDLAWFSKSIHTNSLTRVIMQYDVGL